mgnify:FL=1
MSRWYLEGYFDNDKSLQRVSVEEFPFFIGRDNHIGLTINQNDVSQHHAEIFEDSTQLYIRDLSSTNGTFINHHKIHDISPITINDVIHFAHIESRLIDRGEDFIEDGSATHITLSECSNRIPLGANDLTDMITNSKVDIVFQAVVNKTDQIVGYEILAHGNHSTLPRTPGELFRIAESIGLETELSELFRSVGLQQAADSNTDKFILVNMHPTELENTERLLSSLKNIKQAHLPFRVILEIHEQAVSNLNSMNKLSKELEQLHIGIAYDDFGAGQARLVELSDAPPDIVKFDIQLIQDIDLASPKRLKMLKILVAMVHHMGVKALAEGVSRKEEAQIIKDLGFDLIQGFYYGQPLTYKELAMSSIYQNA